MIDDTLSQDGFKPQCSGLGVIDCTGECAGTEEEFKKFMDVMYDKDFDKKFPELAKEKHRSRWQGDVKKRFKNDVLKCTNFSQETMALLSLVNPNEDEDHEDAEVSDLTKDTQPAKDACVVRNMTCARFPSRNNCKGIAVGR